MVCGTGRFTSPNRVEVVSSSATINIEFKQAIIAAGSEPAQLPGIPYDDPRVIDSTGALELAGIPERLLVIGGGIIGLEMATVFMELGSQVTVVELMDELMLGADRDLVKPLERRLAKRLEAVHTRTRVIGVTATDESLTASFEGRARAGGNVLRPGPRCGRPSAERRSHRR